MGILDGLIDSFNCSRWIRYNFEKIYSDYKRRRPDAVLWREYENRPCQWYIYYMENDGTIHIDFFQSYGKRQDRWSMLIADRERLNIYKLYASVLNQYGVSITDPWTTP